MPRETYWDEETKTWVYEEARKEYESEKKALKIKYEEDACMKLALSRQHYDPEYVIGKPDPNKVGYQRGYDPEKGSEWVQSITPSSNRMSRETLQPKPDSQLTYSRPGFENFMDRVKFVLAMCFALPCCLLVIWLAHASGLIDFIKFFGGGWAL